MAHLAIAFWAASEVAIARVTMAVDRRNFMPILVMPRGGDWSLCYRGPVVSHR